MLRLAFGPNVPNRFSKGNADDPASDNFFNLREDLTGSLGQIIRRQASARRGADDDSSDHAGFLVRNAEVVVDAGYCELQLECLIGQEVIGVPRFSRLRNALRMAGVCRMVGGAGV